MINESLIMGTEEILKEVFGAVFEIKKTIAMPHYVLNNIIANIWITIPNNNTKHIQFHISANEPEPRQVILNQLKSVVRDLGIRKFD